MWEHFLGPGTVKVALKVVDHVTGGACRGAVEVMDEITSSPGYTKHRIEHAQETISDFWDDHKDAVVDFVDGAVASIGKGLEVVGDIVGDIF